MANYPGPWEWRLFYSTTGGGLTRPHVMRVSLDVDGDPDPGSEFADYTCVSRLGLAPELDVWTDNMVLKVKALLDPGASIIRAELWKSQDAMFNFAFQSTYSIGVVGTAAGTVNTDGQLIITFRSQNGGSARINVMEPNLPNAQTDPYPFADAGALALADYITGHSSPVIARDNGYLFAALNLLVGSNEAAFKDRLR